MKQTSGKTRGKSGARALRLLAPAICAAALIAAIGITALGASTYSDTVGHWGEAVIDKWSEYGVLRGNGDGTFAPERKMTVDELATVLVNTFGYSSKYEGTLPGYTGTWGEDAVRKAVFAGVMTADEASAELTREFAAGIIARALGVKPVSGETKFADDFAISARYKPYVNALGKMGVFNGDTSGRFMPDSGLKRAEVMQVFDNTLSDIIKEDTAADSDKGVIVTATGVTLSDSDIAGDLIIAHSVGDGDVTLDSVKVGGRLVVFSGGNSTIHIKGASVIPEVLVSKTLGQPARVVVESADAVVGAIEEEGGTDDLDKVGFYDPNYDYTANKRFKVTYMGIGKTVFNIEFDHAFAHWASLSNVDYTGYWSAADNDTFLSQITAFKEQGYDGALMEPDMQIYPRIAEICAEIGLNWMGGMGQPMGWTNAGPGEFLHPYVGFDQYSSGVEIARKLLEHKNANWPDATPENTALLCIDMTASPPLHDRVRGAEAYWLEQGYPQSGVIIQDVADQMTLDMANTLTMAATSTTTSYEYWLVCAVIDDFAQGAALAIENNGLTDNSAIATVGGTALRAQWDAGKVDAWRYAYTIPNEMYSEPIFFALYAFMSGQATPETIWPSWVNLSTPWFGTTYAQLLLPSFWMEYDSYQRLLGWADVYAGSNTYGYPTDGITRDDYVARVAIPDYYKTPAPPPEA
jgi:hypothetical protein